MAKYTAPEDIQIAALQQKAAHISNLMVSGSGIPWEDRGSIGFVRAFFTTAFSAMFKPVSLLSRMRRPETRTDANRYAIVCGAIWFLAVVIQSTFAYYVYLPRGDMFQNQYIVNTILEGLAAGTAAVLLPKVVTWMYYKLTAYEMASNAPPVLVYNCMIYLMSPSLLALIPGGFGPWVQIGPLLAAVWMAISLLILGIGRLRVHVGSAIIGTILTTLGTAALIAGTWFGLWVLWVNLMGNDAYLPPAPPPPPVNSQ